MQLAYPRGQERQSALCTLLGYGEAMEKLISMIFGWKEVPCQARQAGGGEHRHSLGAAGSEFQYPLSLVNNSAALSVHLFLHWSQREQPCPPSNVCLAIALRYTLRVFFCLGFFFSLFFLSIDTSVIEEVKYFSLSSPQNVGIFKEEVGGRLAPPASFPYRCHSLAVHHKMSPHAHCIVAPSS